jgi:diguanylate cyclase (GGDEF)-like protein
MALLAYGFVAFDRQRSYEALLERETRANIAVAHALVGSDRSRYAALVAGAGALNRRDLLRREEIRGLRESADWLRAQGEMVRIELLGPGGLIVFSSDPARIGLKLGGEPGIAAAMAGRGSSALLAPERVRLIVGGDDKRALVSTHVPLRPDEASSVPAVVEVVSDVTPLVAGLERAERDKLVWVAGGLLALYALLLVLVGRAERILRKQEIERLASEERVRHHAYHDRLTGLPNRDSLMERLDEAVKLCALAQRMFALLLVDLDRLSTIREGLGQEAGNEVVGRVAARMRDSVREGDVVFRVGAGEFALLLEDVVSPGDAANVARRVIEASARPIRVGKHEVSTAASVGITVFPDDDRTPERLVRNADAAMRRAKEAGRSRFEFYTPEMNLQAIERLELESALQRALANREFVVHYQPRVDAMTRDVVAVEALLRWRHPTLGLLAPERFMALLEDTGLILPAGEWVLRHTCEQVVAWRRSGYSELRASVNVSPEQFRSGTLVDAVKRALGEAGLPAAALELEISESLLVESADEAVKLLDELHGLGVRLSIDDFGAGYTSLGYLKRFPVDFLKLDRSLVKGLPESDKDRAIASAVSNMARSLGLGLVAEGVERQPQAEFLARHRCQELQGNLYGRPVPAEELEILLAKQRRRGRLLEAPAGA